MEVLRTILGAKKAWGFLPIYFSLLTYSLSISNNVLYSLILGNEPFIGAEGTFFIDSKCFKMGYHDILYPIASTIFSCLISKIRRINLFTFFFMYFILDMAQNLLWFLSHKYDLTLHMWLMAYYNACRFGLFFVLLPILHKRLKYFIISIPIALVISDGFAFWPEFLAEIYVFKIVAIIEWNSFSEIIVGTACSKLIDGVFMALIFIFVKKLFDYFSNTTTHNTLTKEAEL